MRNKGFTLVEIIVVIVFIAIISMVALPGIMKVLDKGKTSKYEEYETILKHNLELYNLDNEVDLWADESMRNVNVKSTQLKTSNQDINLGNCKISKLLISKNNNNYDYNACIECGENGEEYKTGDEICTKINPPTCETIIPSGFSNRSKNITIKATDRGGGIDSIWIKEPNKTDYTYLNSNSLNATYVAENSGEYTVKVQDGNGNFSICPASVTGIDKVAPSCGEVSANSNTWTNSNKTITQACSDTGGSGCAKASYAKTYTASTITDTITISDNAGNTNSCTYNVYLDKESPTCGTVLGASTTWTRGDRIVAQACSDTGGSGCAKASYAKTYTTSTKTDTITISDNAGNTNSCTYNVYTEKCTSTIATEGAWGECSASCGGGNRSKTITNKSIFTDTICSTQTISENCNTHSCYGAYNCNIRGNTIRYVGHWRCDCGSSHTTAYTHYCSDQNGNVVSKAQRPDIVTYSYICPNHPYGPGDGWFIISD